METIAAEFETKKTKLKSLEETKQKLILKQREKEGELASKEDNIKKIQGQLSLLKTNKEYQAKLSEIESLKADKSLIEEEILKAMDEIDAIKISLETEKKALESDEKIFSEKKSAAAKRSDEINAALSHLEGKRKVENESIDKRILSRYEHILQGKNGLAIVKAENNSCSGCFMHVPHQVINQIKMHEEIIVCESCARILYLDEDMQI